MLKSLMLIVIFTTTSMAQLPPTATPTVSPTATPAPAPVVTPPSPSPTPVPAPAPAVPSPSPSPTAEPSPAPSTPSPTAASPPGPSDVPTPAPSTGPPADVPPSGTFADGWTNRAVIAGTALAGAFFAATLMEDGAMNVVEDDSVTKKTDFSGIGKNFDPSIGEYEDEERDLIDSEADEHVSDSQLIESPAHVFPHHLLDYVVIDVDPTIVVDNLQDESFFHPFLYQNSSNHSISIDVNPSDDFNDILVSQSGYIPHLSPPFAVADDVPDIHSVDMPQLSPTRSIEEDNTYHNSRNCKKKNKMQTVDADQVNTGNNMDSTT
ncbi:hypothetical protein L1987_33899 [Smallanthus sonchifolius]|uniref:Uncharacterized protein n=1 Tax=Smallanthus sonchifolius TaxID=185202 RepID=A0ACB9HT15_9ASTR|nr:hypothetical protein L1987_33899 [Smallanthus sonchifolius]